MNIVASPNHKSHLASCCNHYDLTNKMVPLTMPSVSCHTLFQLFPPNEQNCATDDAITLKKCWCQWHPMTRSLILSQFDQCDLINAMTTVLASQIYVYTFFRHCLDMSTYMKAFLVIVETHLDIIYRCRHIWACLDIY